uniref:Uncharacterized protein n=1 Tax=Podoviridae sp. ct6BA50 TaxID=2825221 RepID=A0A8S5VG12_9CAUD|nr:MAG TPA: hypothetical protein [Podoviridae sp. ct6BA50]
MLKTALVLMRRDRYDLDGIGATTFRSVVAGSV